MSVKHTLFVSALSTALAACGGGSSSNDAPAFEQSNYAFSVIEDQSFQGSVVATDSDTVNYTVANAASNGVFALNANGSFTYTPNANFNGTDTATVQASDGNSSVTATLTFDVNAVNDAPELVTSFINVSTSRETATVLSVNDVDNDEITFALVQAPEKGTLTLSSAGEVVYQAPELETIDGSFVISYTDGFIDVPIEATIDLKAALITNADKLSYYYSSSHSHLAKAEAIRDELIDDIARDDVNIKLAEGFYLAGFEDRAEAIINSIDSVKSKANAYRYAGEALDLRSKHELAATLRAKSEENYNLYMVEKGIENISSSDASYYLSLNNDYIDAGQVEQSSQLMARVQVFADAVREQEYNRAYGYFLSSFNFNAEAVVEAFFANRTAENYQKAVDAAQYLATLAEKTGYRYETSGDNKGLPSDRIKALYVTWAAEYFFNIGAEQQAKKYVALALSLYGKVGYDADYIYPISQYSETTTDSYQYPLELLTGLYAGLYPESETNSALEVLIALGDEDDIADARVTQFAHQITYAIESGVSVAEAAQPAIDYFTAEDDYRSLYQTLVEYRHPWPRAATLLFAKGEVESAKELLNLASDILTSQAYVDDVKSNTYVTGWLGCYRLTELQQIFGGDAAAQAQKCQTVVKNHYTTEADEFSNSYVYTAHRDLMGTLALVGDTEGISAAADVMLEIANAEEAIEDKLESQIQVANYLNKFGLFEQAQATMTEALSTFASVIESGNVAQIESALSLLTYDVLANAEAETGYSWAHAYMFGIKNNVTNIEGYADHYAANFDAISPVVEQLTNKILTLSNEDIQDMMEDLVQVNFFAGRTQTVDELIGSSVNGEADVLSLKTLVAEHYSEKDDLPSTHLATIDTDNDGMPNFFILGATEEEISASGLVLDLDSDNDGVEDPEDTTPLGTEG